MKLNAVRWLAAAVCTVMLGLHAGTPAQATTINGAGASFPFPLYAQWTHKYHQLSGVKVNYQSMGSGGGIAQIKAKTIHFGASDDPLPKAELDAAGLIQFPMIMGGVVPVINVRGIKPGEVTLSSVLLADIFLGKITHWNDKAIAELNPGVKLPNQKITIVRRSDGAGTTSIFTDYLSKVSSEWKEKVGAEKTVEWPVGVGGRGNEGVAAYVRRVNGSIGYVEYAYALQNKLAHVRLINRDGGVVEPSLASFQAAAANAQWIPEEGFAMFLTDQPGKESWPITGVSYILMHKEQTQKDLAQRMLKFFDWSFKHGQETAENLHYVTMPENVIALVHEVWAKELRSGGQAIWPAN